MEFLWPYTKCILCLQESELTKEHIIPEALGGRMWARFLCKNCNDNLGNKIEAEAKRDPSIRLAIENLRNQIPILAEDMSESQIYIGKTKDGPVRGIIKDGVFRPFSSKGKNGSLKQWTGEARKAIEKLLKKDNFASKEVQSVLRRFDEAPANTRVNIFEGNERTEGIEIIKSSIDPDYPDLNGQLIEESFPLKIAYEFLACVLGKTIYDGRLDGIRDSLLKKSASEGFYKIERTEGKNDFSPFHRIFIKETNPIVSVHIRLFDWLIFRIHFLRIEIKGPKWYYSLDLHDGNEDWGVLH